MRKGSEAWRQEAAGPDTARRFAASALLAFVSFVVLFPVSCGGLVLWNEHRYGDVGSDGPAAVLGGLCTAAVLALLVGLFVWRRTRVPGSRGYRHRK